jgi:putative peptidoglycan lipid II flippase
VTQFKKRKRSRLNIMKDSCRKNIGKASLILMASVFLSRVLGLVREMTIAWVGGVGPDVDAYQIAFIVPEILNHASGSGFLSITFIPIFTHFLVTDREQEGWKSLSIILSGFGMMMALVLILTWVFAAQLLHWLAPGVSDPRVMAAAVHMTRIIVPAQGCFFIGGLLSAVQYAQGRFLFPALAPLVYNTGMILGGLTLGRRIGMEGFSWGVLAGAFFGHFLLQWIGARRVGLRLYPCFDLWHPILKRYLLTTLPLILGIGMSFSTEIFYRFFGSYLATGSIAALNYGLRIVFMLAGVFGQAVGTASYPYLSQLAAEGKHFEMNRLLNSTIRYLVLIIPVSVFLMVMRHELVVLLFQRGRFDLEATRITAGLLPWVLAGSFAFSAQTLVVRGYYAMQNTLTPSLIGTMVALLCVPIFVLFMKGFGTVGVAFSLSLSAWLQVGILYGLWAKTHAHPDHALVYRAIGKMIGIGIVLGAILEPIRGLLRQLLAALTEVHLSLALCASMSLLFLVLMSGAAKLLHIEEWNALLRRIPGIGKMGVDRQK